MAGRQIRRVQQGEEPIDWKPFPSIGPNVREIRIRESGGAYRVIYQATLGHGAGHQGVREQVSKDAKARGGEGAYQIEGLHATRGKEMRIERYKDVWDAIEDDPVERERLKMRSRLMSALQARIEGWNLTQAAAAKRLNITQPRLNDLLKDRFNKFSLGALFDLATRAGLKIKLTIDETEKKKAAKRAA